VLYCTRHCSITICASLSEEKISPFEPLLLLCPERRGTGRRCQRAQQPIEDRRAGGGEGAAQGWGHPDAMRLRQGRQEAGQDRDEEPTGQIVAGAPHPREERHELAAAGPDAGSPPCGDSLSFDSTRPKSPLVPACRPPRTAAATPRHTLGALAPSRGLLSGAVGHTGFEGDRSLVNAVRSRLNCLYRAFDLATPRGNGRDRL